VSGRRTVQGSVVGLVVALLVVLIGILRTSGDGTSPTAGTGPAADRSHVPAGTLDPAAAGAALGRLRVAAKGGLAGYERDCGAGAGCVFGPAWADVDGNGCGQRDDVLHRDLTDVRVRAGTGGCVVLSGTLADPYTGTTVRFSKTRADEVQIDHVVPLAAAWRQGASRWTTAQRERFADDLANLIATTAHENESKGEDTADEWVPPAAGYGCSYASVVVTVKQRYGLSVTAAEAAALRRLLATC
jgi:Protein of unknown function (DUF1524)